MNRRLAAVTCLTLLVGIAFKAFADTSPQDVLKSKGLVKQGVFYVLDTDLKLPESLRNLRKAEALLDVYARKCKEIQHDIDRAKDSLNQYLRDRTALESKLSHTPKSNTSQYNDIIGQINQCNVNIHDAVEYIEKRQGDLSKLSAPTDQIQITMDLATKMDAAESEYEKLAADPDVTAALAKLSAAGTLKFRLGPMGQFKDALPKIRAKRDAIDASALKLDTSEGGVGRVTVTLNGTERIKMVLDSGAGLVSITKAVADQIGLKPGKDAPTATMTIADGSHVKAILATIASIRLGKFVAENVECAILPASIKQADCLLGGSFLRNFIYQIDLANGELHLSPITATVSPDPVAPSTDSPSADPPSSPRDSKKSTASAPPPDAAPTTAPPTTAPDAALTLEINADIDGSDDIDISATGINWTHGEARWPAHVKVNGETWDPHKQHLLNASDNLKFLDEIDFSSAQVVEKSGRGDIGVETKTDGLHVHFQDGGRGADHYHLKISFAKK